MKQANFVAIAVAATIAGCATPPKTYSFEKSRTYALTKDQTWEQVLTFFTSNNIQIKTIEKDSGVIYAERSLVDASIADCGENALAQEVSRTGGLNVFVRPVGAGQTQVSVNSDYKISRVFDGQLLVTQCNSTGLIEGQILRSVQG